MKKFSFYLVATFYLTSSLGPGARGDSLVHDLPPVPSIPSSAPENPDLEPDLRIDPRNLPFDEASFAERVEYFTTIPGRRDWGQISKKIVSDVIIDALALAGTYQATGWVGQKVSELEKARALKEDPAKIHNNQHQKYQTLSAMTVAISGFMAGLIRNPLNAIRDGRRTPKAGMEALHSELVRDSNAQVSSLPSSLKYKVHELDHLIRSLIAQDFLSDALLLMRQRQKEYLHFPSEVRDMGNCSSINKKIKKLVSFLS